MKEVWQFAIVGLTAGGAYALTALGVVAVYRGTGVLNLAQGAIGMVGAYVFWELYQNGDGWSVIPSIAIGVAVGALVGLTVYLAVIRPMVRKHASEVARIMATLGILLLLQGAAVLEYGVDIKIVPPLFGIGEHVTVFGAFMSRDTLVVLCLTLALAVVLAAVFRFTRLGITATALRSDPVAAAAVAISPHPTGMLTWALGGGLGALAGIVLLPLTGLAPAQLTLLVIPALAAGLLARFRSFLVTVAAGLAMGVAESILTQQRVPPGLTRSVPFVVIIVALVLRGASLPGRGQDVATRLPRLGSGVPRVRTTIVVAGLALLAAFTLSSSWAVALTTSAIAALIGLSIVVVTGYAGQLSLAPFALAGVSALVAAHAGTTWDLPFVAAFVAGILSSTLLGLLIGAPAVRVRGVNLAIVTLGLGLVIENTVLRWTSLTGGVTGITMRRPNLFGFDIEPGANPGRYAAFSIIVLVVGALAVTNLRSSRAGRRLAAVRSNERGAAALGISVPGAKLGAFAISAALAGAAGALTVYRFQIAVFSDFVVFASILAVGFTIMAGVGYIPGGLFAGLIVPGGILSFVFVKYLGFDRIDSYLPILTGIFVIDAVLRHPDGIVAAAGRAIQRLVDGVRRRSAPVPPENRVDAAGSNGQGEPELGAAPMAALARRTGHQVHDTALAVRGLTVRYGPTVAVDGVSFDVTAGRVLGVIGPNGAGKTTLIDALTGFVAPNGGSIELEGVDVSRRRPTARARKGLVRTFQNLELFEDLTVRENLLAAVDRRDIAAYVTSMVRPERGRPSEEVERVAAALELTTSLDVVASDLPQGVRRLVAIARVAVASPAVICLDEPAAGLNNAERKRASHAFRSLARDLGAGVVLVEHNVDVVTEVCDELIVLDFGKVIARGPTHEVLADEIVREAYLGIRDDAEPSVPNAVRSAR